MRATCSLLLTLAMTMLGASAASAQESNAPIYVAGYIEVMPTAAREAAALLRQ